MCGYGAGETGKHRFFGGSQLRRCGSTEGSQPFVPGCRGGSALLGSRGNAHWQVKGGSHYRVKDEVPWRVEGSRPIGSRVKRLAQGKLMPASTCTGYYLTQTFAGFVASPPFPSPGTSSQEGGRLFETDTTQRALRQAWHLQSPPQ
ncbi:MAG: hypothetical protein ACLSB9_30055 [Hydrogeniiclostridium mannosilyticum]